MTAQTKPTLPADALNHDSPIRVREMRVIWRDTFIVEDAGHDFLDASKRKLRGLECYVADTHSDREGVDASYLKTIERVSRGVASIGYPNILRFQFAPIQIANIRPTLKRARRGPYDLSEHDVREAGRFADKDSKWSTVTPMLLLHQAGVGIMEYHVTLTHPDGFTSDAAIDLVRMGINAQLLALEENWRCLLPDGAKDWPIREVYKRPGDHLLVGGLRDLSQGVMAARLGAHVNTGKRRFLRRDHGRIEALPPRPTGSASIVLVDVDPTPGADFDAYCAEHAAALRGIGAMDVDWRHRAAWLIERELGDNLSTDAEMALYLLGSSELLLFNEDLPEVAEGDMRRLHLPDFDTTVTYFFTHYTVLMEWVYLQEAILRWYLRRVDALAASATPVRREVIHTLQGALGDLVEVQEDITPYSTRVEFLKRANTYRNLDVLAERFEKKQERLIDYASEYHDYREARATEFLNWLAGILTGAALANLITSLIGITPSQTVLYLGINLGSIAVVLAIMWWRLRRG